MGSSGYEEDAELSGSDESEVGDAGCRSRSPSRLEGAAIHLRREISLALVLISFAALYARAMGTARSQLDPRGCMQLARGL